jgi:septal ring factor EnvC (AmiA/AmiB activator)
MSFCRKLDSPKQQKKLSVKTEIPSFKENGKLKQELDILSDQVNNCKCITSDLNTKVKQLEDEQKSLITAIKIVQNDHNTNKQSTWSWNVVKNRKPNQN